MVAGMIIAVMLTTGRTVGAEQRVLGSIDTAGTRSITIRAEQSAGVTSDAVDRIAHIDGVEWAAGFSAAVDATNTLIPDGTRVPARFAYGPHLDRLDIPREIPLEGTAAYVSPLAAAELGMVDTAGAITLLGGPEYAVVGALDIPDFLTGLQPVLLIPQPDPIGTEPVALIMVIAERPDLVAPVSDAVLSVLGADDFTKVTVQTSETLAHLRALIQGQLGGFSRGLVLAVLALTGALVAILLTGLVLMRRKDYGRRRALGATRGLIVALLLTQTGLLATLGVALGAATSTAALLMLGDPLPGAAFTASLGVLALATALLAALIPAITASRREPIRELRVP
ncbi:lipoprotein ABC transporter permease [Microbacterium hominis]|uniref:Lipoprotein ABC transporter permease n=2 Tax=Microbacterium hominis TaxID=162426 RepID=A0A7D4QEV4_9MICO|nr:lipoprotein ABC transporter permease [Microbacterium hominis]